MLTPILALIIWTLIIWVWMYALRIPAMQKAKFNPQDAVVSGKLNNLPENAVVVADNYNHLHEAPTIFYALAFYVHLSGGGDTISIALAWAYVALRVVHSIAQIVLKRVMLRFMVFSASTLVLALIAIKAVLAL